MKETRKPTADFPDWISPMLVKELRQGLSARAFVLSFIGLQVVLVLVTIYHSLLYARNPQGFNGSGLSAIFWMLLGAQLLVVTPVRALGALANERKANTLELIFMTGLTPWRIAWGKWASLVFQALLFLLAVLPYSIMRYFFGGVNLAEELIAHAVILMLCGIFSAVAVGISGLPVAFRVVSFCIAGFFGMSVIPGVLFGGIFLMRGGSSGLGTAGIDVSSAWPVLVFDAVLLVGGALEIAATTIAPPAENHAFRQRAVVLAAWAPVPLLFWLKAEMPLIWTQIALAMALSALLCWVHISDNSEVMRPHIEPFRRFGRLSPLAASLFLLGWPSALLFLLLLEIVAHGSFYASLRNFLQWQEASAVLLLSGAALMTPPLLWTLIRRRPRWPFVEHMLVLSLSGAAFSFLNILDTVGNEFGAQQTWLAAFPPVGFWAMLDGGLSQPWLPGWWFASLIAFATVSVGLGLLAIPYWKQVLTLSRRIRATAPEPAAKLPVAA